MRSVWQANDRRELQTRLTQLPADCPPQWGRMNAPQMVSHLIESLRMATGELPVASKNLPLRYPPLKQFIIYLMPFPKSAPTAPELIAREPTTWADDVQRLSAGLDAFASKVAAGRWPEHPAFGRLSAKQWGILVYRHMDHHLRQFGV